MKMKACCFWFCSVFMGIAVLQGCKKQFTGLNVPAISEYYPLSAGKVFIYRLDSTHLDVTAMQLLVSSYLVKDSMGVAYKDNAGHTSFPIYRFITDTLNNAPWQALYTYYVTETNVSAEVVDDNNLRFIKLTEPITDSFSWNGNSYINTLTGEYQYMDGWNYTYQNVNMPFNTIMGNIDSTITVLQVADTLTAAFDPAQFQQNIYSSEVYGKGIGLIYKKFLYWTWQPTPQPAQYQPDSYGIVLNLISVK